MPPSKLKAALLASLMLAGSASQTHAADPAPMSPAVPGGISERQALVRANRLLAKMTLEEKVGQISQRFDIASLFPTGTPTPPGMPPLTPLDEPVRKGELGALLFVHDITLKTQRFEILMRKYESERTWCFVGFAALDADATILDHVKTTPAVPTDDFIHFYNERSQRLLLAIDGNRNALFEFDDNLASFRGLDCCH